MKIISLLCIFLFLTPFIFQKNLLADGIERSVLDENGCHLCKDRIARRKARLKPGSKFDETWCERHGFKDGEKHRHLFLSTDSGYKISGAEVAGATLFGAFAWPFMDWTTPYFDQNFRLAIEYISLSENREKLIIGASSHDLSGSYEVLIKNRSTNSIIHIAKGLNSRKEIFNIKVNPSLPGLYTAKVNGNEYTAIYVYGGQLIIINNQNITLCAGEKTHKGISLYCGNEFASESMKQSPTTTLSKKNKITKLKLVKVSE